jgi:hypothetical protein
MPQPFVPRAAADAGMRKCHLSPSQKRLVELMGKLHFGRLESLHVRRGEPVFDPPPRVISTLKVGGRNEPRPEASSDDFLLKSAVVELLAHLQRLGEGVVDRIQIANGVPLLLEICEPGSS